MKKFIISFCIAIGLYAGAAFAMSDLTILGMLASAVSTITTNFNDILSSADTTTQKALDTLDDGAFNVDGDRVTGQSWFERGLYLPTGSTAKMYAAEITTLTGGDADFTGEIETLDMNVLNDFWVGYNATVTGDTHLSLLDVSGLAEIQDLNIENDETVKGSLDVTGTTTVQNIYADEATITYDINVTRDVHASRGFFTNLYISLVTGINLTLTGWIDAATGYFDNMHVGNNLYSHDIEAYAIGATDATFTNIASATLSGTDPYIESISTTNQAVIAAYGVANMYAAVSDVWNDASISIDTRVKGLFLPTVTSLNRYLWVQVTGTAGSSTGYLRIDGTTGGLTLRIAGTAVATIAYASWHPYWNDYAWNTIKCSLTSGANVCSLNGTTVINESDAWSPDSVTHIFLSGQQITSYYNGGYEFDYFKIYSDTAYTTATHSWEFNGNLNDSVGGGVALTASGTIAYQYIEVPLEYNGMEFAQNSIYNLGGATGGIGISMSPVGTFGVNAITSIRMESPGSFVVYSGDDSLTYTNAGQLQLPTTGSGGGLLIGGDVSIYRGAANELFVATGDKLCLVNAAISANGSLKCWGQISASVASTTAVIYSTSAFTDDDSASIIANCVASNTATDKNNLYHLEGLFFKDGAGNIAQQGSTINIGTIEADTDWNLTLVANTTNQTVDITAVDDETAVWSCNVEKNILAR